MAGELQSSFSSGKTCYFLIRDRTGQIWNTSTSAFVAYATASYSNFTISATEQGTASSYYAATFPSAIVAGTYSVVMKNQAGGTAAETDATVAAGNVEWNGTAIAPISDTATSGLVGQGLPLRMARGVMVQNFKFKLVSATDHVTPFTSGVCSGQINRDNGTFGALQSGTFTEEGLGFYRVTLTSGDVLANTIGLSFSATGVSGGTSDARDFSVVLQRTSGQ